MWQDVFEKSPGIELVRPLEGTDGDDEAADCIKAVFRIEDRARWGKQVHKLLKASVSEEDPTFQIGINKAYYLDDTKKPTFAWSLLVWGDLEKAEELLAPILMTAAKAPPAPPKEVMKDVISLKGAPRIKRTVRTMPDGSKKVEFTAPLPHYSNKRNSRLTRKDVQKHGSGVHGAVVDGIDEPIEVQKGMFDDE